MDAFKRVKANMGNAGVDNITTALVEKNKRKYLYHYGTEWRAGFTFPRQSVSHSYPRGSGRNEL